MKFERIYYLRLILILENPTRLFATIAGHAIHYEESGSGHPLFFLHGGVGTLSTWKNQVPFFSKKYRTIAYDRFGHGLSGRRGTLEPGWYAHDAVDLFGLMDVLGVGKAAVIGFSDGGTVALAAAGQRPDRFSALIVEGAHAYLEKKTSDFILQIGPWPESGEERAELEKGHGEVAEEVSRGWYDFWTSVPKDWSILDSLKNISAPTLVILGDQDETATVDQARRIARSISRSRLWIAEGQSHSVHWSAPDLFNAQVADFLESAIPAS